jgi:hypothetical protein
VNLRAHSDAARCQGAVYLRYSADLILEGRSVTRNTVSAKAITSDLANKVQAVLDSRPAQRSRHTAIAMVDEIIAWMRKTVTANC